MSRNRKSCEEDGVQVLGWYGAVTLHLDATGGCHRVAGVPRRYRCAPRSSTCGLRLIASRGSGSSPWTPKFVLTGENSETPIFPNAPTVHFRHGKTLNEKRPAATENLDRVLARHGMRRFPCAGGMRDARRHSASRSVHTPLLNILDLPTGSLPPGPRFGAGWKNARHNRGGW